MGSLGSFLFFFFFTIIFSSGLLLSLFSMLPLYFPPIALTENKVCKREDVREVECSSVLFSGMSLESPQIADRFFFLLSRWDVHVCLCYWERQKERVDVTASVWKVSLIFRKVRWQFDKGWEDMEENPLMPTVNKRHLEHTNSYLSSSFCSFSLNVWAALIRLLHWLDLSVLTVSLCPSSNKQQGPVKLTQTQECHNEWWNSGL